MSNNTELTIPRINDVPLNTQEAAERLSLIAGTHHGGTGRVCVNFNYWPDWTDISIYCSQCETKPEKEEFAVYRNIENFLATHNHDQNQEQKP